MRQPDRRRVCARRPGSPGECAGSHCRFSTACRQCPPPPRQLLRGRFWTLLALGVLSDSPWKRGAQPLRGQAHAPHGRAGEHPALRSPICTILRPDLLIVAFSGQFSVWFHTFSSGSLLLVSVPSPHLARTRQGSSPGPLGAISCVMLWPLHSGGPGPAEPPRWAAREAAALGQSVGDMKWPVHLGSSFCSLVLAPEP